MHTNDSSSKPSLSTNPIVKNLKPSRSLSPAGLASTALLSLGLLGSQASFAFNPTEQAVINYLTDPTLCTPTTGGGGGDFSLAESGSNVFATALVGDSNYDCSNLSGALQTGVERLLNSPETLDVNAVLQGLAFEEVITMGTLNVEVNSAHMSNIMTHVDGLHHGTMGIRFPSLPKSKIPATRQRGGGAAASNNDKIGFFVNTRGVTGEKDVSTKETGFDYDSYGLTAGMDMRLSNNFVIGFAAGYGDTQADYTSSVGGMDMQGYSLSVFGTMYKKDSYFIDGIINLTQNQFDSRRTFTDPNAVTQTATADTDGTTLTVGLGAGYENHIKDTSFGNYVRINYTKVDIDSFTESGAGVYNTQIDDQDLSSFEGVVGFNVSKVVDHSWGVLIPQIRLELVHEFENESRIVNARFTGAVNNGITTNLMLPSDRPDRTYINLSLAASAQFSHGRSGFVQYTGLFGQNDIDEHGLELGVRWSY